MASYTFFTVSWHTSNLVARYLFGPGALNIFCLVSEPGRSGAGALNFLCLVSEPGLFLVSEQGRSQPGTVFIFSLISEPARSGPGALFFFCLVSCARNKVCHLTVKNV